MNNIATTGAVRVLIVEDNRDTADTTAMLLSMHGYDVAVAYDGKTAIRTAKGFDPDVILLDLSLPDIDGYTVARNLRDEGLERASLVAVTGYAPDDEVWSDVDFADHLIKPVGKDALVSLLDRVHASRS